MNAAHPGPRRPDGRGAGRPGLGRQGDGVPNDANGHGSHVAGIVAARQDTARRSAASRRTPASSRCASSTRTAPAGRTTGRERVRLRGRPSASRSSTRASAGPPLHGRDGRDRPAPGHAVRPRRGQRRRRRLGDDNDVTPTCPCAAPQPNVICVGRHRQPRPPGRVLELRPRQRRPLRARRADPLRVPRARVRLVADMDGTSMAAPHVAGTLALMRAAAPALTAAELKEALLGSVDNSCRSCTAAPCPTGGLTPRPPCAPRGVSCRGPRSRAPTPTTTPFPDVVDNCPSSPVAPQSDGDDDGLGDACARPRRARRGRRRRPRRRRRLPLVADPASPTPTATGPATVRIRRRAPRTPRRRP